MCVQPFYLVERVIEKQPVPARHKVTREIRGSRLWHFPRARDFPRSNGKIYPTSSLARVLLYPTRYRYIKAHSISQSTTVVLHGRNVSTSTSILLIESTLYTIRYYRFNDETHVHCSIKLRLASNSVSIANRRFNASVTYTTTVYNVKFNVQRQDAECRYITRGCIIGHAESSIEQRPTLIFYHFISISCKLKVRFDENLQ